MSTPFDLSKVLFLTTANVPHTIPGPLRDRLESSICLATPKKKRCRSRRNIWFRNKKANGIDKHEINIQESAIVEVILKFTRESRVRSLERELASICRKIARDIVLGKLATLEDQGKNKIRLDVTDSSVETSGHPEISQ